MSKAFASPTRALMVPAIPARPMCCAAARNGSSTDPAGRCGQRVAGGIFGDTLCAARRPRLADSGFGCIGGVHRPCLSGVPEVPGRQRRGYRAGRIAGFKWLDGVGRIRHLAAGGRGVSLFLLGRFDSGGRRADIRHAASFASRVGAGYGGYVHAVDLAAQDNIHNLLTGKESKIGSKKPNLSRSNSVPANPSVV